MEKTLFADLVQSLKEAKAKGKVPASRRFEVAPPDVKSLHVQPA